MGESLGAPLYIKKHGFMFTAKVDIKTPIAVLLRVWLRHKGVAARFWYECENRIFVVGWVSGKIDAGCQAFQDASPKNGDIHV